MKKFTIILAVLIAITITTKAQYSNVTLNGAWMLYQTPLSPYNDSLLYLIFDGNGNITDCSGFGTFSGSNYSVSTSGAITVTLVMGDEGSFSFEGQLSSQDAGTLSMAGMSSELSRISNPGALTSSITGTLSTDNCGQKSVTITLDNQGIVTSATGLDAPVSGRAYTYLGVFLGHFKTGASDSWNEFSIMGYYSNNTLHGEVALDANDCGNTSAQLIRQDATDIISVNSKTTKTEILPNPAKDAFQVTGIEGTATLRLSDLNGRLLFTKEVTANETVSVSTLPNGIYLVGIKSNNVTKTEKLIIRR